jgi:hypothetical protein
MSNLYNMTKHININDTQPLVSWKGQTFSQITSVLKKNANTTMKASGRNLFLPNPLKIYRREIASQVDASRCNSRASIKIDEFTRPNGFLVTAKSSTASGKGLVNTLDINLTSNKTEKPGSCTANCAGLSPAENAKRRCRSSGNIKKAYNPANNTANYYTDSKQYLTSRNRTFQQNQYYYLRSGDSTATPGETSSINNVYAANGTIICPNGSSGHTYYKPNNPQFAQQGAVSASSLITRKKYDSITNSSAIYRNAFGLQVANALAYGVPENGYTIKDKIGYPNKCTPVFSSTGVVYKKCN